MVQAGLDINMASYLAHCVNINGQVLGNLYNEPSERKRCFWSIYLLQHLQGEHIRTMRLMTGIHTPFNTGSGLSPSYASYEAPYLSERPQESHSSDREDLGLISYTIHLSEVWSAAMSYAASRVGPDSPPPWSPQSDYSTVTYRHVQFDSYTPLSHRYHAHHFQDYRLSELSQRRYWWCPWFFIQFLYATIPCLLNHPFLLSMRLRSFRHTMPQSFIRQSFEHITINTAWILHFIDLLEHKGFQIGDPVIGHCVVVVATIHLQHSFAEDAGLREKSREGFSKCLRFLHPLGQRWPHIRNMV